MSRATRVVAAAAPVGDTAANAAIIVKLTRVLLLAPLVILVGLLMVRAEVNEHTTAADNQTGQTTLLPPFLLGFVALVLLGSVVALPDWLLDSAAMAKDILLAGAMFGLGTGVVIKKLAKQGRPALAVGGIVTIVMAVRALIAVRSQSVSPHVATTR